MLPGEVHLWQANLDVGAEALRRLATLLSGAERDRAVRFVFEKDRGRFMVARALLRWALGAYLDRDPDQVRIDYGAQGKPMVEGLQFNLSHSHGLALFAFSLDLPLGVDVERIRPLRDVLRIAQRHLEPAEAAKVLESPEDRLLETFFRAWSRKEACVKAEGAGLFDAVKTDRWQIQGLDPAPGWVGALAVGGQDWTLKPQHFPDL